MARLLSIVLSAVLASLVAAESLSRCGSSSYYPSQYTCFNDNFLCPIVNGDRTIRCGDACYSTSLYSCSGTTLEPINTSGPETLEDCGPSRFYPSQYVCLDGNFLCPIIGGAATLRCGAACYAPSEYICTAGHLAPAPAPPCVPNFGSSEECGAQGCIQLRCCPGLISVATKCRDPCDLAPASCKRSAR